MESSPVSSSVNTNDPALINRAEINSILNTNAEPYPSIPHYVIPIYHVPAKTIPHMASQLNNAGLDNLIKQTNTDENKNTVIYNKISQINVHQRKWRSQHRQTLSNSILYYNVRLFLGAFNAHMDLLHSGQTSLNSLQFTFEAVRYRIRRLCQKKETDSQYWNFIKLIGILTNAPTQEMAIHNVNQFMNIWNTAEEFWEEHGKKLGIYYLHYLNGYRYAQYIQGSGDRASIQNLMYHINNLYQTNYYTSALYWFSTYDFNIIFVPLQQHINCIYELYNHPLYKCLNTYITLGMFLPVSI